MTQTGDHWLLQYDILQLVKQCQRLILAEFGEKPALSDIHLRDRLADYAGRSRSLSLQHLYGEIRLALIRFEGPDVLVTQGADGADAARPQRMYRGRPVAGAEAADKADTAPARADESGKTVIYRGKLLQSA